jgi:DNA invertase Pin-like site-specific DNA recombinase
MKCALYTRVSTSGKGQDAEVQVRELREYVARRGWAIVEEFSDSGFSGAKRKPAGPGRNDEGCAAPQV